MKLYSIKNNSVGNAPIYVGGMAYTMPMPMSGVYSYVEPTYDIENETIGKFKIENNIATNEIIPFKKWKDISCNIRLTMKRVDCEKRKNGKLADFMNDTKNELEANNIGKFTGNSNKYELYVRSVEKIDGFELLNGVLSNQSQPKLTIETFGTLSETTELISQV